MILNPAVKALQEAKWLLEQKQVDPMHMENKLASLDRDIIFFSNLLDKARERLKQLEEET